MDEPIRSSESMRILLAIASRQCKIYPIIARTMSTCWTFLHS